MRMPSSGTWNASSGPTARNSSPERQCPDLGQFGDGALLLVGQLRAQRLQLPAMEGQCLRPRAAALESAADPAAIAAATRAAHERLVANPPWLYIVHDLNPRAMSRRAIGFVPAQSWFVDLTLVDLK